MQFDGNQHAMVYRRSQLPRDDRVLPKDHACVPRSTAECDSTVLARGKVDESSILVVRQARVFIEIGPKLVTNSFFHDSRDAHSFERDRKSVV